MTIQVTAQHITYSIPGSPCNCAVANAIREQSGIAPSKRIVVLGHRLRVVSRFGREVYYYLPITVQSFITAFDNKLPVSPFSFELELN